MVTVQREIVSQVYAAKKDIRAADDLIRQYTPFIRSETVKFTHAAPERDHEDELSIAMLAFYEAIASYEKLRGPFLAYAARGIRNRLIDHYRREKRHGNLVSLHTPAGDEGEQELLDTLPHYRDEVGELEERAASQREIQEFGAKLASFGLSFSDVADNCPRQERTLAACRRVMEFARTRRDILLRLEETGRLPMAELAQGGGVDKKTLERHRKYLVAILLAFTNGYEIIRSHLHQLKGGGGQ